MCLKKGCNYQLDFDVRSDPSLETQQQHSLCREGKSHCESRIYLKGNAVVFKKAQRSDAGQYTVTAFNASGKGSVSFKIKCKSAVKCE